MSLNSPTFTQETSSRPGTSQARDRYDDGAFDTAVPQHLASPPTHGGAIDEVVNTTENYDDGANQQPAHAFLPFFTLIQDAHTSDYYHPTVHYIFSDDDTDIVTEAALRSVEAQQDLETKKDQPVNPSDEENGQLENEKSTLLPPSIPGVRENYIVLDIEPTPIPHSDSDHTHSNIYGTGPGALTSTSPPPTTEPHTQTQEPPGTKVPPCQYRVTGAKTFSPTWQVLRSELVAAPTFENQDSGETPGHGLMLKIYGTGGLPADTGRDKELESGPQRLEEMMDQFAKRMQELQMVIDTANLGAGEEVEVGEGAGDERESEESGIPSG